KACSRSCSRPQSTRRTSRRRPGKPSHDATLSTTRKHSNAEHKGDPHACTEPVHRLRQRRHRLDRVLLRAVRDDPEVHQPAFVEFELAQGVGLALWSGHSSAVTADLVRTSEVCLNLPGGPSRVEEQYARWRDLGVDIAQEPHDDVFGRTFVAKDVDGNLLRVAPVDPV
ncbi:MAG: hypothetical protein ACRYG2_34445, partial [Janthinobacterium lividum]